MSDDFTTFRAAHPSVSDAIAACDRPDWLVQLAWEVADPKTAVRIGLGAAQLSSTASDTAWLFKPNPDRLETVAAFAGDGDGELERSSNVARAVVLASVPAVVLAYVVASVLVWGGWTATREVVFVGAIAAFEVFFAFVVRGSLAGIVRRRATQLDDRAALDIVLDEVRKGTAADPRRVPIVVKSVGSRLLRFVNAGEGNRRGESQ